MKRNRRFTAGLSLLEVLLVLLLIALLSRWSMTGWQQYQQRLRLDEVSEQLLNFLSRVEKEATTYDQNYGIQVINTAQGEWQVAVNSDKAQTCNSTTTFCFTPLWKEVELVNFLPTQGMQFYGVRGGANGGHITLANSAGRIRVVLSAKGRLRRCSEQGPFLGINPC